MQNTSASNLTPRSRRLGVALTILAVMGVAVWGIVSRKTPPEVSQSSAHLPLKSGLPLKEPISVPQDDTNAAHELSKTLQDSEAIPETKAGLPKAGEPTVDQAPLKEPDSFKSLLADERLISLQKSVGSGFTSGQIFYLTDGTPITQSIVRQAIAPTSDRERYTDADLLYALVDSRNHVRVAAITALKLRYKEGPDFRAGRSPELQKEAIAKWCSKLSVDFEKLFSDVKWKEVGEK